MPITRAQPSRRYRHERREDPVDRETILRLDVVCLESGMLVATSEAVPGLTVQARGAQALERHAVAMIKALYATRGDPLLRVHPIETQPPGDASPPEKGLSPGSMLFRLTRSSSGR